jgi:hypothetical protein
MSQRQRGPNKHRDSAMNDETTFDPLLWIDPATDSRLANLQKNLITLEDRTMQAIERFMPRPIAGLIKKKFDI